MALVPGMGDLRGAYRFLVPPLRDAGYRVVSTDLRGHGGSDTTFASYGDVETGADIVALIEGLGGGPAIVVGNSMGAGAAVYAAAERPELIHGLVLIGPFVRNGKVSASKGRSCGSPWPDHGQLPTWNAYLPKLYKGKSPVDFAAYRKSVVASLRRPGYAKAFSLTTRTDHSVAESRLGEVAVNPLGFSTLPVGQRRRVVDHSWLQYLIQRGSSSRRWRRSRAVRLARTSQHKMATPDRIAGTGWSSSRDAPTAHPKAVRFATTS